MRLKRGWTFVLALVLQLAATRVQEQLSWAYSPAVASSYALLLAGALSNLNMRGFWFLVGGLLLNLLPMLMHNWYMPVARSALAEAGFSSEAGLSNGSYLIGSKSVLLAREDTALWFLADIFPMRWPVPVVLSLGDLVILLSLAVLIWDIGKFLRRSRGVELQ